MLTGSPALSFSLRIPLAADPAFRPLAFSIVLTDREPGTGYYWPNCVRQHGWILASFFCEFVDIGFVSVHKHANIQPSSPHTWAITHIYIYILKTIIDKHTKSLLDIFQNSGILLGHTWQNSGILLERTWQNSGILFEHPL